ncbi:hypothetical protein Tco_0668949, partial [Tanacetum coccineum]
MILVLHTIVKYRNYHKCPYAIFFRGFARIIPSDNVSVHSEDGNHYLKQHQQDSYDIPIKRTDKLVDSDVHTLEDPKLILENLSRRFFLRLNLPDHRYEHDGQLDTRTQDDKRSQDDDQRLDLADDLKKAQDHIS